MFPQNVLLEWNLLVFLGLLAAVAREWHSLALVVALPQDFSLVQVLQQHGQPANTNTTAHTRTHTCSPGHSARAASIAERAKKHCISAGGQRQRKINKVKSKRRANNIFFSPQRTGETTNKSQLLWENWGKICRLDEDEQLLYEVKGRTLSAFKISLKYLYVLLIYIK